MCNETPLIYTTKGNIPIEGLNHSIDWEEYDDALVMVETYKLGDEIVKQSRHIRLKQGLSTLISQTSF